MLRVKIESEIGRLKSVLIHEPGPEVEAVTPANARMALYGDILNISVAKKEYVQFKGVLKRCTQVYELKDLFLKAISNSDHKIHFIRSFINECKGDGIEDQLISMNDLELFNAVIRGIPFSELTLTNFLNQDQFAITPLHNLFFMRDTSFAIGNRIFISNMAKEIRKPETLLVKGIFPQCIHPDSEIVDFSITDEPNQSIEGGDVIVVDNQILVIGLTERTSSKAIDMLVEKVKDSNYKYIIAQELPVNHAGAFIHLDMVFTILSDHECMVYKPVVHNINYKTVLIELNQKGIQKITLVDHIIEGLKKCHKDFKPIYCGNNIHIFEEREQWHSGANFFALAPGKVIGYERNVHTNNALSDAGYEIIKANDFICSTRNLEDYDKCVITIEGSELSRGGGGARCMTLPLERS